jgi:hypothetical protein
MLRTSIAVNEVLARKYFHGKDPLGMQLDLGGKDTGMIRPYTIVGVIGDQVDTSTSQPAQPFLMIPYRQVPTTSLFYQALIKTVVNFVVKTRGDDSCGARHAVGFSRRSLPIMPWIISRRCRRPWTRATSVRESGFISPAPSREWQC